MENQINDMINSEWVSLVDTLKWPVLALITVLIFRKPIVDLINRVTKVGYGSKSLEAKQQSEVKENKSEEVSVIDRVVGLFRPETINMFKTAISQESEFKTLQTAEEKVERLTNYACVIYIMRHFDIIYNSIFGSQIRILEHVNSHSSQTKASVKFIYEHAKQNNPRFFETYSYDEYLAFLFNFNLLRKDDDILSVTILGVDFLKYLTEMNKDVNKWH